MGLITETNYQYYEGEEMINVVDVPTSSFDFTSFNTLLENATQNSPTSSFVLNTANYILEYSPLNSSQPVFTPLLPEQYTSVNNFVTCFFEDPANPGTYDQPVPINSIIRCRLVIPAKWNNYGGYEYTSLVDVINNFMIAYVGEDKTIANVKRSDVVFHAQRGLQEFSYDTLKSVKSQELSIPPSLSLIIPQDYVNYVQMCWIDSIGVKHIIYPTTLTSNPYNVPIQDNLGVPMQDELGENIESTSITNERWKKANDLNITGQAAQWMFGDANVYNWQWWKAAYGERYGLDPQYTNENGWFTIDEREGKFSFSSNLRGKIIILDYISDGLAYDEDIKIPKMAEEAMYMHIMYSILSTRRNIPEYIVQRFKKERRAKLRNAKIRLSNIKLEAFTQIMRGKSKWIKH